jgi:hypothetical protein
MSFFDCPRVALSSPDFTINFWKQKTCSLLCLLTSLAIKYNENFFGDSFVLTLNFAARIFTTSFPFVMSVGNWFSTFFTAFPSAHVETGYEDVKSGKECRIRHGFTNLVITSPNEEITSINGNSGSDAIRNDVKAFFASSHVIYYFPRGLEKFFPNIKVIYINNCQLKTITKQNLEPFSQLTKLYLQFNEIEELEDDLFAANEKLLYINLHSNKIKFIGDPTFEPLKHLNTLYLHNNPCINKDAENDANEAQEVINETKIKC